jgi:hypothetical protein
MRDSNSEPNQVWKWDLQPMWPCRGPFFSPLVSFASQRASGTRIIYAFAVDELKSRSYLTHMNLLFLQIWFPWAFDWSSNHAPLSTSRDNTNPIRIARAIFNIFFLVFTKAMLHEICAYNNAFCRFKSLNLSFIPSVLSNMFKKQYKEKKWNQI